MDRKESSIKILLSNNYKNIIEKDINGFIQKLDFLRALFRIEMGFLPPRVSYIYSKEIPNDSYSIIVNDEKVDSGQVPSIGAVVFGDEQELKLFDVDERYETLTGAKCKWIISQDLSKEFLNSYVCNASDIISFNLFEIMRYCASKFFDYHAFLSWKDHPDYARYKKVIPLCFNDDYIFELLSSLLKMKISINNRWALFQGMKECRGRRDPSPGTLAENIRRGFMYEIERELCERDNVFIELSVESEFYQRMIKLKKRGLNFPELAFLEEFKLGLRNIGEVVYAFLKESKRPVLVCPSDARTFIESIVCQIFPEICMITYGEMKRFSLSDSKPSFGDRTIKIDDHPFAPDFDFLRWFKSRFSVYLKKKLSGKYFFKVAPIATDIFWLDTLKGAFLLRENDAEKGFMLIERAINRRLSHFLPDHTAGEFLISRNLHNEAIQRFRSAAEKCFYYYDLLVERGLELFVNGESDFSYDVLKSALRLNSGNSRAYSALGELYRAQGKNDKAMKALKKALELSGENLRAMRLLGWMYMEKNDLEKARDMFQGILAVDPKDSLGHYGIGMVFYNRKQFNEAKWEFYSAISANPEFDWAYYRLGWLYLNEGDIDASLQNFLKAYGINPENIDFIMALAIVHTEMKNLDVAHNYLKDAVRKEPGNIKAREMLARLLSEKGNSDAARYEYEILRNLCPDNERYYYETGVLLLDAGNTTEAIDNLKEAVRINPYFIQAVISLGWALMLIKDFSYAERVFIKGIACEPDHHPLYYGLASLYFQTGKIELAERIAVSILKIAQNYELAHFLLSRINRQKGNIKGALLHIARALEFSPENTAFLIEESEAHLESGATTVALDRLNELRLKMPDNYSVLLLLGRACKKAKRYTAAEKYLLQGMNQFPSVNSFYLELFLLYEEMGDFIKLESLEGYVKKCISTDFVGRSIEGLIAISCYEIEKAQRIFVALSAERRALSSINSYLALIYFIKKEYKKAERYFRLAEIERNEAVLKDSYAVELMIINNKAESYEKKCKAYIEKKGSDPVVERNLGQYYLKTGQIDLAFEILKKCYEKDRQLFRIHILLGELHYRRGELDVAESVLREGIKLFPHYPELYVRLGQLVFELGSFKEGEKNFNQALALSPVNIKSFYFYYLKWLKCEWDDVISLYPDLSETIRISHEALMMMACAFAQKKMYKESLLKIKEAGVNLADRYLKAELVYSKAISLWMMGNNIRAGREFALAEELNVGVGNALLSKPFILFLKGDFKGAKDSLIPVQKKRLAFTEAYYLRGLIGEKEGDFGVSEKNFAKAVKLCPGNTRYKEGYERIRQRNRLKSD